MIDRDHLRRQTGDDVALQQEILGIFVAQMRELDRRLAAASADHAEGDDLAPILHRSRGAALAVGAGPLAAGLAQAELERSRKSLDEAAVTSLRLLLAATLRDLDG